MVKLKRAAIARTLEKSGIGGGEQMAQRLARHRCTGSRSESDFKLRYLNMNQKEMRSNHASAGHKVNDNPGEIATG